MYKFNNLLHNIIRGGIRMKKTYTIIIHKEEDMFWAECPELSGCFAQSKDIDELKNMMKQSIYLYFNEDLEGKKNSNEDKNIKLEFSYA